MHTAARSRNLSNCFWPFLDENCRWNASTSGDRAQFIANRLARLCPRNYYRDDFGRKGEAETVSGEWKEKISHNHSIGMTINGRNLLCGLKLLFSVCEYNNLGFYGLVMDSQTAMW